MPESHKRRKDVYTPPPTKSDKKEAVRIGNPRWLVPTMLGLFIVGLLWIVIWYVAPDLEPWAGLAGWNVAIGFAFITVGFILATRWR